MTTQIERAWGAGPTERYEQLASRFRPLFDEIAKGALDRELSRTLPQGEIDRLKQAGLGALRIPVAEGGLGATLPELERRAINVQRNPHGGSNSSTPVA